MVPKTDNNLIVIIDLNNDYSQNNHGNLYCIPHFESSYIIVITSNLNLFNNSGLSHMLHIYAKLIPGRLTVIEYIPRSERLGYFEMLAEVEREIYISNLFLLDNNKNYFNNIYLCDERCEFSTKINYHNDLKVYPFKYFYTFMNCHNRQINVIVFHDIMLFLYFLKIYFYLKSPMLNDNKFTEKLETFEAINHFCSKAGIMSIIQYDKD